MIDEKTLKLLDYQLATRLTGDTASANFTQAKRMFDGDHWLDGDGWKGPTLNPQHELYSETMSSIEELFVAQNIIAEVVSREVRASSTMSPSLSFTLKRELSEDDPITTEETEMLERVTAAFFEWFNNKHVGQTLTEAAINLALGGYGGLRLVVPATKLEGGTSLPKVELKDLGRYLFVENMEPGSFVVTKDPISFEEIGIFKYETSNIDGSEKVEKVERTYLDEEGNTIIETRTRDEDWQGSNNPVPLLGAISMFQMERRPLITDTTIALQMNANLVLTMMAKNTLLSGFLERIFLNAQPPVTEVDNGDGTFTLTPAKLTLGANSTSFINGIPMQDPETGEVKYTTPDVFYHDPSDPTAFVKAKEAIYHAILEEVQQTHVLMTSQGLVSGESRRQARSEFAIAAEVTAQQVATAVEWLAMQFIAYAELMTSESLAENLHPVAVTNIDIGPLPAEEVGELVTMFEAGMISAETALTQYGLKNVSREIDLIFTQQRSSIREQESRAKQLLFFTKSGVDIYNAALVAGFGESTAQKLLEGYNQGQEGALNAADQTEVKNLTENTNSQTANPVMDRTGV